MNFSVLTKDTIPGTIKVFPTAFNTFIIFWDFTKTVCSDFWGTGLIEEEHFMEYPYKDGDEKTNSKQVAWYGLSRYYPFKSIYG